MRNFTLVCLSSPHGCGHPGPTASGAQPLWQGSCRHHRPGPPGLGSVLCWELSCTAPEGPSLTPSRRVPTSDSFTEGPIPGPSRRAHSLALFTEGPPLALHGGPTSGLLHGGPTLALHGVPISDPSRRAHGQARWAPASSR